MYDVIIIGGGPAGLSASIYTIRKKLSTLVLTQNTGGQVSKSFQIENYLGFSSISGTDLIKKFQEHIKKLNIQLKKGVEIKEIQKIENGFKIISSDKNYEAKTIIIASGKKPRQLNIPGEKELQGRGVSYCPTCDAPLFTEKTVAVIGGGNSALDAALQLSKIAEKIYLININPDFKGDEITKEKIKKITKIEILTNTESLKINGENLVEKIIVKDKNSKKEKELKVQGIFVEIGYIPNVDFIKNLIELNKKEEIKIDCKNQTNIPGIFAAGDVTDVFAKQNIIAAGEGAKAALSAFEYLSKMK